MRAKLVEAAGGDADEVWTTAHEHTGELIRDRFGELRGCAHIGLQPPSHRVAASLT